MKCKTVEMKCKIEEMLSTARELDMEQDYLNCAYHALAWDLYTETIPENNIEHRQLLLAYLKAAGQERSVSETSRCIAAFFQEEVPESPIDQAIVREIKNRYRLNAGVSQGTRQSLELASLKSQEAWRKAYRESDYRLFQEDLKEVIRLKGVQLQENDATKNPFRVLMEGMEPGFTLEEVDGMFQELKIGLLKLLNRIQGANREIDDSVLDLPVDRDVLKELCEGLVERMGYDSSCGGYGDSLHPMSIPLGPKDVRILNKYENFKVSVFSMLHEGGHAIYSQNSAGELKETSLWPGIFGSMQEGQARLYENIIGRSREFWTCFYPEVQERLPIFREVALVDFVKMVNRVMPIPIRVDADEVTYCLHIIIRYEIERDLFEGHLAVEDLPAVWTEKYRDYLGISNENDRVGLLQDPHWSLGYFGYFPGYALGNIYSGQIYAALKREVPDVMQEIEKGNFAPLNQWLKDNIHSSGHTYTTKETIKRATGEEPTVSYYLEYLNEKYESLYALES